jgi:putative NIF3 family GTP cyclohydrolase 1 type 2
MLVQDRPELIIACHDHFDPASGGTSDMVLRGLLREVPVWLVPGEDPDVGRWMTLKVFPQQRLNRVRRDLDAADPQVEQGLFGGR